MPDTIYVSSHDGFLRVRPEGAGPLPTVVHVPGFNEDAASAAPFALRLAAVGFQCLALTPPWESTPELNNPSPAVLFELLDEAEQRLQALLDSLAGDAPTRADWVALTGFSMGGMFVSKVLAQPRRYPFRGAAMVLSTGDWSFLPRTALEAFPDLQASLPASVVEMAEEALRVQSPIATPERFPPTPLLLLSADRDPRVPLPAATRFHAALQRAYEAAGAADALHWHVHQGNRHEFRRAMQRQVRDWLLALREGSGE